MKIYSKILPNLGYNYRKEQEKLSLTILHSLQQEQIALSEAGVGTGKTHAYILATVIHNLFQEKKTSTVLSTSSIALQKAITEEYLPQISEILQNERIIEKPLRFVVRKGKGHYFCRQRAISYRNSLKNHVKYFEETATLTKLIDSDDTLDLDNTTLLAKSKISVQHCDKRCGCRKHCSYRKLLERSKTHFYDFQIINHNYFIADVYVKKTSNNSLLADFGQVIIDEAHKLPSKIWDMYGLSFHSKQIGNVLNDIFKYRNKKLLNHNGIMKVNNDFFKELHNVFKHDMTISFSSLYYSLLEKLQKHLNKVQVTIQAYNKKNRPIPPYIEGEMTKIQIFLENLQCSSDWILAFHKQDETLTLFPKDLNHLLYEDFWQQTTPTIFTSGTLSIAGDFSYFKTQVGLNNISKKIIEMTVDSPFDYKNNGILYIPKDMPFADIGDNEYIPDVAKRISELIEATHGHSLILFTSYRLLYNTQNSPKNYFF